MANSEDPGQTDLGLHHLLFTLFTPICLSNSGMIMVHACLACSSASESEEDQAIAANIVQEKQNEGEKTKKNINEYVEDADDRYLLHVAVYSIYVSL